MGLLDNKSLEASSIVANCRMNRQRGARGVNSYEKELRLDPVGFLRERLHTRGRAAWLDICCGSGTALIEAAQQLAPQDENSALAFDGIDLVGMFPAIPRSLDFVDLRVVSLHDWAPSRDYDLITCVHGLHYVGDKLAVVERCCDSLMPDGSFVANLDLHNLRSSKGGSMSRALMKCFREFGLDYNTRTHVLSCAGRKAFSFKWRYLGADDGAGANYTGQEAVNSHYELP